MYPIRFEPIYQNYIWGGDRIPKQYHRTAQPGKIAESWEISDRKEGMSLVANGEYKGRTLHDLVLELGEKLYGQGKKFEKFPLLLKIIDAKENLSIQVHPDESTATLLEGEPKTEMWFALDKGSVLAGLKKNTTEKGLMDAIKKNKAEDLVEKIELEPGDVIYIPGGRVHAICAGSFLYEIQQNSNTTYRLYDWGRVEKDGKPRPLHIKEAFASIHWQDVKSPKMPHRHLESDMHHQLVSLITSPFFIAIKVDVFDRWHGTPLHNTFQIFFCIRGEGKIIVDGNSEPFQAGMTYLVPAAAMSIELAGKCEALWIRLP